MNVDREAIRETGPRVRAPRGRAAPAGLGGRRRGAARRCTRPPRSRAARRLVPRGGRRRGRRPARLGRAAGGDVRGRRVQRADGRRCSPAASRCRTSPPPATPTWSTGSSGRPWPASRSARSRSPSPAAAPTSPASAPRRARDGDHYVVNGAKTFITCGVRADFVTTAVRTGGPGPRRDLACSSSRRARPASPSTGRWRRWAGTAPTPPSCPSSTSGCRSANLVGEENTGFAQIAEQFVVERIALAVHAYGIAARVARADRGVLPRPGDLRQAAGRQPGGAAQAGRDAPAGRGRADLHPRGRRPARRRRET